MQMRTSGIRFQDGLILTYCSFLFSEQAKYAINRFVNPLAFFRLESSMLIFWGEFQEVINGGDANSTLNQLAENWKELKDEY